MRVGIDFRAMQVGHQFRGIGEVLRNACRQLDQRLPPDHEVVAFRDAPGPPVAPLLASLFGPDRTTTVVDMPPPPGGLCRFGRLRDSLSPDQAGVMAGSCDVLVQFDFLLGVPGGLPTVLVIHDQVPLLLGDRYPEIYWPHYGVARRRGLPRRMAAERALRRWLYEHNLANALRRAAHVVANSHHTGRTTVAFAQQQGIEGLDARLTVCQLGCDAAPGAETRPNAMERARFEALGLVDSPFVFYLGGVDDRRRIDLLVSAFNHLRAGGLDLKLVLAGDSFATLASVGVESARRALMSSSYAHDIHLLGFVSQAERDWLYRRAGAFVFPSEHEGFGLPVLESLAAGCAVVTFDNSSLPEVCGPNCELVTADWRSLAGGVEGLLARSTEEQARGAAAGKTWAAGFTWDTLGLELAHQLDRLRGGR